MKIGELLTETKIEDLPQLLDVLNKHTKSTMTNMIEKNAAFAAEIGDQGRITIPSAERRKLKVAKGDLVQVFLTKLED